MARGRHRVPDSSSADTSVTARITGLRAAFIDASGATVPAPRHRASSGESWSAGRPTTPRPGGRAARHTVERFGTLTVRSDNARGAHRAAQAPTGRKAWVQNARRRPQLALAALVAVGLALTALPIRQDQNGESTSVMTAAAEAVGVISRTEKKQPAEQRAPERDPVEALPAATGKAPAEESAPPVVTPSAEKTEEKAEQAVVPVGDGPFNSLRTTGSKTVMLSFDDGPDPIQTPKILDLLAENQTKAVFCLVGTQARRHPDLVKRIADEGHVLCNHTWSHDLSIGKKKKDQILADLNRTNAAIRAAVPDAEIPYFRAPGGNFTDRLVKTSYGVGMTSLYWEVDPRDWEHLEGESSGQHTERIVKQVRKETRDGAIVLSHDFNQPDTIKAYAELLPWLMDNFEIGVPGHEDTTPEPDPSTSSPNPSVAPSLNAPSGSPSPSAAS
ncbi:polysaccharide deacetylase family protein [Actinoplanes couchii]|uniref:NodB homology domain-containing protein n=1 Tax=Actinoplanes couchii TaxID=403638 RepID=A0ABQ3X675_9ACTN|nr:polysaccharide deacetylase family protein [Actinoplanes couchii]MDR6325340.1 peptidoglycan/xylan/chitin deacetylase (PgdA/CDA1 family) [Actinoplanes couchii]GID53957.1 hypothetical protein Aco03nite_023610 [Actinoplanes couchii]